MIILFATPTEFQQVLIGFLLIVLLLMPVFAVLYYRKSKRLEKKVRELEIDKKRLLDTMIEITAKPGLK